MDETILGAMVTGYEHLIQSRPLQADPDDRHVIAAAIVGRCDVIVTNILAHFPRDVISDFDLDAQSPDDFLVNHLHFQPDVFCSAVRTARVSKKNPPYTVEEYLSNLMK